MKNYYDEIYYKWQKKAGEYGANQDLFLYQQYIKDADSILDFGCGGGYLLQKIICKGKYGIEINDLARKEAVKRGIKVFNEIEDLSSNIKFDEIISHHALEHVENPAMILRNLKKKLKSGGKIICVVPIDDWRQQKTYIEKDINKHLYTWTPLLLGNLFIHCGYKLEEVRIIDHAWLPLSRFYFRFIPKKLYYVFTNIWSKVVGYRLIRIIASK